MCFPKFMSLNRTIVVLSQSQYRVSFLQPVQIFLMLIKSFKVPLSLMNLNIKVETQKIKWNKYNCFQNTKVQMLKTKLWKIFVSQLKKRQVNSLCDGSIQMPIATGSALSKHTNRTLSLNFKNSYLQNIFLRLMTHCISKSNFSVLSLQKGRTWRCLSWLKTIEFLQVVSYLSKRKMARK